MNDDYIILSMTTIPSRESIFEQALNSILRQSYRFDKLVINIDDEELFEKYKKYESYDYRIELNFCDKKWKSCNKLIPTLQKYPKSVIITVDDDLEYPKDCVKKLIEKHKIFPNYIISQENFPIFVDKETKRISYGCFFDVKLEQAQYGKYLSNCCLYPPHTFEGTNIFNYDAMVDVTLGIDDEMWFWINSALKGIKSISLNYVFSLQANEIKNNSKKLCTFNLNPKIYNTQIDKLNSIYGERLYNIVTSDLPEFFINNDNAYLHCACYGYFKKIYTYGYKVTYSDDVTAKYKEILKSIYAS